jgi:Na+:H+ antiporter, NhaA family
MKNFVFQRELFQKGEALGQLIIKPFQRFAAIQASGGVVMLAAALVALTWANSSFYPSYEKLFHSGFSIGFNGWTLDRPLHFWINEGLMTFFFFVVGLEIKREVLVGDLSSFRQAILPAVGALGGMVAPAGIYYFFNQGTPSANGWGIPMATDIAFVMGALMVLGQRLPSFLAVFLVSLAIFDDLGAVIVIAAFYTTDLNFGWLLGAGALLFCLISINILGFRRPLPYLVLGAFLWVLIYLSGIHATIAGILVALTIPARSRVNTFAFSDVSARLLRRFRTQEDRDYTIHLNENNQAVIQSLRTMCRRVEPPLQRIEHSLHRWVFFGVMPLFALANSGVRVDTGSLVHALSGPEALGIIFGLFVGKQIGIFGATWLCVKSGLSVLPVGTSFRHIYGGAVLCGIGFTMSLFIADLSYSSPEIHDKAKIAIMVASVLSAALGMIVLYVSRTTVDEMSSQISNSTPEIQETTLALSLKKGDSEMLNPIVLLVDDEEAFVKAMERRLSLRKIDIMTAFSGEEALRKLQDELLVDVVILDLKMPGMGGLETLRLIKERHPLVEVIILTGHGAIDTAVQGMKDGAFDYLAKPCDLDELIEKVVQAQSVRRNSQGAALAQAGRAILKRRGV